MAAGSARYSSCPYSQQHIPDPPRGSRGVYRPDKIHRDISCQRGGRGQHHYNGRPWGWFPFFKKGWVCSNCWGITLLSLPGKAFARVLERKVQRIVKPRIQEEQCGAIVECLLRIGSELLPQTRKFLFNMPFCHFQLNLQCPYDLEV